MYKSGVYLDKVDQGSSKFTYKATFTLPDQVSQFRIAANIWGSDGSMGFSHKDFSSTKLALVEFVLPTTLTMGDKIDVPYTVMNNHPIVEMNGFPIDF
jgi:uncharacterized protein YfaS (alpha-2-macroglobulin family)